MRRFILVLSMFLAGPAVQAAPHVVASFPPLQSVVAGVMDGVGTP